MLKNAASDATIAVQPSAKSISNAANPGTVCHTDPFSETSTKCQCRINPPTGIVNIITRSRKGNRHLGQSLENTPNTGTHESIRDNHVSRPPDRECLANTDKDAAPNVGT